MDTIDEKIKFIERTYYHLRNKGLINTWTDFAEKVGVTKSTMSAAKNGNERALTTSFMKKVEAYVNSVEPTRVTIDNSHGRNISNTIATGSSFIGASPNQAHFKADESADDDLVPVIPHKLYKDPDTSVVEYLEQGHKDIQMAQAIHQFGPITCYKFCNNDAMIPDIRSGDLLALQAVERDAPIINGETYVLDVKGVGLLMRIVEDISDTEVLLTALNSEKYKPIKLKKDHIYTLFRIVGYTRTNV